METPALLHPTQREVAKDTHRFRVVCAGRRWGKSLLACWELLGYAVAKNGNDVAYIAPTFQQARDLAWQTLREITQPVQVEANETRLEIVVKTKGGGMSKISLRGWESIETLRGMKFAFVVVDEIAMMRGWDERWQEVVRPTLTDRKGHALFISTPSGFNHFYELYNKEARDRDYKSFHFVTGDNPYISKTEIDKAALEITEDRFAQEYLADFRKTEGLVYKEFDRTKHLFRGMPPSNVEVLCGIDFGYTNPTAIHTIVRDRDEHFWVTEEWYYRGKTNAEVVEYARSVNADGYYPDPAEPDRIEELKRAGLNVRFVSKDVTKGIDAVRNLFKNNRLHIHYTCRNLIMELETYSYKPKRPGQNEPESPEKVMDHACFKAGTKIQTLHKELNIEDVRPGDFVWSGVSWTEVEEAGETGEADVFVLALHDGRFLIGTREHPVFVFGKGLVPLGSVKYNDEVWLSERRLSSEENRITVIPKLLEEQRGLNILQTPRRNSFFIERFFVHFLGMFLMGWRFIIKTAIPPIMLLKISSFLRKPHIQGNIKSRSPWLRSFVAFAVRYLRRKSFGNGVLLRSAIRIAELTTIIKRSDILPRDGARFAGEGFLSHAMERPRLAMGRVVSVQAGGREKVYNLKTVDGIFAANGVVVSNCDALRYCLYSHQPLHRGPLTRDLAFQGRVTTY